MSAAHVKATLDQAQQEHIYQQTAILEDESHPINAQVRSFYLICFQRLMCISIAAVG